MLTLPTSKLIKDFPSIIIGCELIISFKKLFAQNLPPLGNEYFADVGMFTDRNLSRKLLKVPSQAK